MPETTALVSLKQINAVEVFTGGKLVPLLNEIESKALDFTPDLKTATSRKEIASMAFKVSRSKTLLDGLGKALVDGWKAKAKVVDESRKEMRTHLDLLRDKVRQPLTEFEQAEEKREEKERLDTEFAQAWDDAQADHELWLRGKEIERREAELVKQEKERLVKAAAEQREKARLDREEQIRKQVEEKAKRDAEEATRKEREHRDREKWQAEERAKKAEQDRIVAIERAKFEQERAVKEAEERVRQKAERAEHERLEQEAADHAEAERKATNTKHRKRIHNEALAGFVEAGFSEEHGKEIMLLIINGNIRHVSVIY